MQSRYQQPPLSSTLKSQLHIIHQSRHSLPVVFPYSHGIELLEFGVGTLRKEKVGFGLEVVVEEEGVKVVEIFLNGEGEIDGEQRVSM